ncbi:hypothetical protein [Streptomyces hainanensis]|uniref:Integral membrane protein n=1 Tax=Streptomyces hainanensis TaxID=402648 RepID=A0A4R4TWA3_9ACTN|nr:hypothetical protein [Streptomyces hainanensis]TDC80324.1 hypothetical protein E1283_00545 [Streptomyces hainanensis]
MPVGPPPRRGLNVLAASGVLLVLFTAQFLGALLPNAPLLCAAGAGGLGFELALRRWRPGTLSPLNRLRFDETVRQLLRDLLSVVGVGHLADLGGAAGLLLVGGLLACYAAHFLCRAVGVLVRRQRTLPVLTRNVDADELRLSPAPPRLLTSPIRRVPLLSAPATVGLLVTAATGGPAWGLLGVGVSLALFCGAAGRLATWLLPAKRPPAQEAVLEWFRRWLAEYRPEVGLYFSGGSGTAYQANMWLSTMAALDRRALVVLRERPMLQQIAATDLPVVCLPRVANLMLLEHSSLKVLIHPANAPRTSQVLRIPTIKHAFVNHGESDKLSSCNPYAKVYDEVWVAGPAARRRYALADVGVDDRDVVEVGRPQLAPIRPAAGPPPARGPVTVLYAPTWEGWTDDPGNTSVILAGEQVVRALLADPRVRLLYKPHPMTGTVNREAAAADARIRALIAASAPPPAAAAAESGGAAEDGAPAAAAVADAMAGPIEPAEPASVSDTAEADAAEDGPPADSTSRPVAAGDGGMVRVGADDLERMGAQGAPAAGRAAGVAAAAETWAAAFWASQPARGHLVLTGPRPDIYSCFNQADVLIADVSSVVADHLASAKPYAVVNTSGLPAADFRAANPTVRAATILAPDAAGLGELLDSVVDPTLDRLATARAELTEYLLGPADPPSIVRFRRAVDELCAAADARRARQGETASPPAERSASPRSAR